MRKQATNFGFTILELLLALSVLSVGIMAAFTLSISNLQTAKNNYQRILAVNLAREGIEIVRNIRDTNWLKIDKNVADCDNFAGNGIEACTWDFGLDREYSAVDYLSPYLLMTHGGVDTVEECYADDDCALKIDNNMYVNGQNGSMSNMARLVHLQAICFDYDQDAYMSYEEGSSYVSLDLVCDDLDYEIMVGLRVTAEVYWISNGQPHTVELVEDLYNWREYVN